MAIPFYINLLLRILNKKPSIIKKNMILKSSFLNSSYISPILCLMVVSSTSDLSAFPLMCEMQDMYKQIEDENMDI
jgi:hypothetical protein